MNTLWESTDRKLSWEPYRTATPLEGLCVNGARVGSGYFLNEEFAFLYLTDVELSYVSFLCTRFLSGRWVGVRLEQCQLSSVCFRGVFFQGVDFSKAILSNVRFEGCVFVDCQMAGDGFENLSPIFLKTKIEAPVFTEPASPIREESSAPLPDPMAGALSRFDGIER